MGKIGQGVSEKNGHKELPDLSIYNYLDIPISNLFFQYLRSRRLNLKIVASEQAILDRDLFLNLGLVQNLSLDLSDHLMIPKPLMVLRYLPLLLRINAFAKNHTFFLIFFPVMKMKSQKKETFLKDTFLPNK